MSALATLKKNGQFNKEMAALAGEKVGAFHKPGSQK